MGVGRRMKKQGAPEPLSEEHFARLKRKAGLPVDDTPRDAPSKKKRRTSQDAGPKSNVAAAQKPKNSNGKGKGANSTPLAKPNGKALKSKGKVTAQEPELDEDVSDGLGDFDLEDDEFPDLEMDGAQGLEDDFLNSDNSVYDSDDGGDKRAMFSEDEDDSDAEDKLTAANIAGLSRKLDMKKAEEDAEAQAELEEAALQTNIDGDKPNVFDNEEEDGLAAKTKALLAPDLQLLRNRITDTIRVLGDFAKLAETGKSRAEYISKLLKDICAYYGYNEYLCDKLFHLFSPDEAFAFFEANETARPVVIRTNTLRTHRRELAQALINRGVVLEPVGKWSKVGLQIFESNVPLGATPEYLAGHYILQAASSFLPVMALAPQENERVLDMAAAPGGKTTHISALMKNTGVVFANDPSKARSKGLIGNIHRLGARNVVVCNYDAREFPRVLGGFDRVLLDAPCSGTGVIAKDPSVKTNKSEKDFMTLPHTQKQLLLAAIDSVNHASKTGGYIVYSTCSVTVEENEQVVHYALTRRPNVKLVSTGLTFGKEGFTQFRGKQFDQSLSLTRRFYPHTTNMDGFFVAKFQKVGPSPTGVAAKDKTTSENVEREEVIDKTPIAADENMGGVEQNDFGGFDEGEDQEYINKAKRNAMRRRGLDPHALDKTKATKVEAADKKPDEVQSDEPAKSKKVAKKEKKVEVVESKPAEVQKDAPAKSPKGGKKEKKVENVESKGSVIKKAEPVNLAKRGKEKKGTRV
ncbi:NOL1/NOP2/sun family-domain-containing protein [Pseudomassariella vexata]|uniref:Nucleolar protein 2 n=1 Tax=Pseudomassariella vexata TaxID=1141098 RepID=A0A1Y2DZ00_9PEZI|nr:NOL1/NOP2/sun family-domain-containing protein [Pseudomassariella vexata]ORY64483.1 NOL1/NOP2/sun family-domain-containing protein [Pseudomassariella vexata]